jgi:hypothetical protein
MSLLLNIKSIIRHFKLHAIEIKHLIGGMDLKKILDKFCKLIRFIKMLHMGL